MKERHQDNETIIAVDLGITNSAVCCAMLQDGTVIGRLFINQPIEKDHLKTCLHRLAKAQRESGPGRKPNFWRTINNLQDAISTDTAVKIVRFAEKFNATTVVFEFLNDFKLTKEEKKLPWIKKRGIKLHFWRKRTVQDKVKEMCQYRGIHFSRINPRNTSILAFDGSGEVTRNSKKDLCTFSGNALKKVYHADLNASYNIGSRYYIRKILNPLVCSEMERSVLEAKVPSITRRTTCCLASLISLNKAR
jgi:IS605 OrfB family transposase